MLGWWFSPADECLPNGEELPIAVGVTHTRKMPELCASPTVLDALGYAHGPILWRVRLAGRTKHGHDRSFATKRTYLATLDAAPLLHEFTRQCALTVIDLWDAPQIVRDYFASGDETRRPAAHEACFSASVSAQAEARHAALAAACAATSVSSFDDLREAVHDTAHAAAWAIAQYAAQFASPDWRAISRTAVWNAVCTEHTHILEKMALAAITGV